jgi:hypothetical protein
MAATVLAVLQLYSIIFEKKPDLFSKRSLAGHIGEDGSDARSSVVVSVHDHSHYNLTGNR